MWNTLIIYLFCFKWQLVKCFAEHIVRVKIWLFFIYNHFIMVCDIAVLCWILWQLPAHAKHKPLHGGLLCALGYSVLHKPLLNFYVNSSMFELNITCEIYLRRSDFAYLNLPLVHNFVLILQTTAIPNVGMHECEGQVKIQSQVHTRTVLQERGSQSTHLHDLLSL